MHLTHSYPSQYSASANNHCTVLLYLFIIMARCTSIYGCGLFTFTYRLLGNARSSPGARLTLKLDMYDRRT